MTHTPEPRYGESSERARLTVPKSEVRKRSQLVGVRFTPDEYADLLRLCAANDLTPGALLRAGLALLTLTETS